MRAPELAASTAASIMHLSSVSFLEVKLVQVKHELEGEAFLVQSSFRKAQMPRLVAGTSIFLYLSCMSMQYIILIL